MPGVGATTAGGSHASRQRSTEAHMASREERAKARDPPLRAHLFAELHRCRDWMMKARGMFAADVA